MRSQTVASGERVEILVDFSDGRPVALQSAPDTNLPMIMGPMAQVRNVAAQIFGAGKEVVLRFEPVAGERGLGVVPDRPVARQV